MFATNVISTVNVKTNHIKFNFAYHVNCITFVVDYYIWCKCIIPIMVGITFDGISSQVQNYQFYA